MQATSAQCARVHTGLLWSAHMPPTLPAPERRRTKSPRPPALGRADARCTRNFTRSVSREMEGRPQQPSDVSCYMMF